MNETNIKPLHETLKKRVRNRVINDDNNPQTEQAGQPLEPSIKPTIEPSTTPKRGKGRPAGIKNGVTRNLAIPDDYVETILSRENSDPKLAEKAESKLIKKQQTKGKRPRKKRVAKGKLEKAANLADHKHKDESDALLAMLPPVINPPVTPIDENRLRIRAYRSKSMKVDAADLLTTQVENLMLRGITSAYRIQALLQLSSIGEARNCMTRVHNRWTLRGRIRKDTDVMLGITTERLENVISQTWDIATKPGQDQRYVLASLKMIADISLNIATMHGLRTTGNQVNIQNNINTQKGVIGAETVGQIAMHDQVRSVANRFKELLESNRIANTIDHQ